jgi:uncharacterized protein with GYD domain
MLSERFHEREGGQRGDAALEAPSDDVAAKLVLGVSAQGNVRTTTLKAFPEEEYRKIVGSIA